MSIQPLGGNTSIPPLTPSSTTGEKKTESPANLRRPDSTATSVGETKAAVAGKLPLAVDETQPVDRNNVEDAVTRIREFVQPINDSIQFSLDDDTGRMVVKVIDVQTKEILRQIPSEEALNIAKALDKLQGILIQNKA